MALQERFLVENYKENVGVLNSKQINSVARKNVFASSKKTNVLADVKNTIYPKQNAQLTPVLSKQLNIKAKKCVSDFTVKTHNVLEEIKQCNKTDKLELFSDDYSECPHCMNEEEDFMDNWEGLEHLQLSDDEITKLCLDPNPKSRYAPPSPELDMDKWYKEHFIAESTPPHLSPLFADSLPVFELPPGFYDLDELLPVGHF